MEEKESKVREYIKEIGNNLKKNKIKNIIYDFPIRIFTDKITYENSLQIFLPDYNFGIEIYDNYYDSQRVIRDKFYHVHKMERCANELVIRIVSMFEDEWVNKKEIILSKIYHILKLNKHTKIYARDCYIEEIPSTIKNMFLTENHLQGEDKSKIKLGLYNDRIIKGSSVLVAVMTFCKPRRSLGQKKITDNINNPGYIYDYELLRYASDINLLVVGGFSKLLRYFERNYYWKKIITYADLRWSDGNLYLQNNFKYLRQTPPNYWYINSKNRYHRFNFRKQSLKEFYPDLYQDNLTEFEIMDQTDYNRIFDCGNLVFEYTKNLNKKIRN